MLPFSTPAGDETLRIALYEGSRRDFWPLFALADDAGSIREYLDQGVVHVATTGGRVLGHSQVLPVEAGTYELRSLGVIPGRRRRGLGTRLVARSASWVREQSGDRLVAASPSAALDLLGFYQRLGFRVFRVDRDSYGPAHEHTDRPHTDGIRVRDRVWLELEL